MTPHIIAGASVTTRGGSTSSTAISHVAAKLLSIMVRDWFSQGRLSVECIISAYIPLQSGEILLWAAEVRRP